MRFLELHGIQESFSWYIVLNSLGDRKALPFLIVDRLFVSSPRQASSPQLQTVS